MSEQKILKINKILLETGHPEGRTPPRVMGFNFRWYYFSCGEPYEEFGPYNEASIERVFNHLTSMSKHEKLLITIESLDKRIVSLLKKEKVIL